MSTETMEKVELTTEQLEALLKERKEKERKEKERKRLIYEKRRDWAVEHMMTKGLALARELEEFKKVCHQLMDEQKEALSDYGGLRKNSKGGFQIVHSAGETRVIRRRDTQPQWDERSEEGSGLIKEFLHTTVKKSNKKLFEVLMTFIEKNKEGELEYARVMELLNHRDKWNDPNWLRGLDLVVEGFSTQLKSFGYLFQQKDEHGKWVTLELNFSAL